MKLRLNMTKATQDLAKSFKAEEQRISAAVMVTANAAAEKIKKLGDLDMMQAGNFGPRWRNSLQVTATKTPRGALITAAHTIPYAGIFETGGVIRGRPLLWLPLPGALPVRPRLYPGGLFSGISKQGKLLLFSRITKQPVFVGVPQVRIPKKFHLTQIVRSVAKEIPAIFRQSYRARKNG